MPNLRAIHGLQHANVSTHPPGCPMICLGDANGDRMVSFPDITEILLRWNINYAPGSGPGDADGNGRVEFPDITEVLLRWGSTCVN